jgi:branched-chain amino acid transport system ATP-binding protein
VTPGPTAPSTAEATDPILAVADVTLRFGGVTSLADVSLQQDRGEILAVIGPNGAGKTSLFNSVSGVYRPQAGSIVYTDAQGRHASIIGRPPHRVTTLGIARTFQNIRLFNALTAVENVKIGAESRQHSGPVAGMLRLPWARREDRYSDDRAFELLEFVGLRSRANELSAGLPYGAQRRLEIARAMCTDPVLLCLDEPAAGLNPRESHELNELLLSIRQEHATSILLIEHDMSVVMQISDHVVVLDYGVKISDGAPEAVRNDQKVIAAYLGVEDEEVEKVEAEVGL